MRSRSSVPDLRSGVLRAAVERFSRDGFDVGLRTIAAEAGVSAAAIIKHFGSKEGLRSECDAHVIDFIGPYKTAAMEAADPAETILSQLAEMEDFEPYVRYCMRSFLTGGDVARDLMGHMREHALIWMEKGVAAGNLKPSRDEDLRVRLVVSISVGWLMQSLIDSGRDIGDLGTEDISAIFGQMLSPAVELYTQGLFTDPAIHEKYLSHLSDPPADDRTAGPPPGGASTGD